MKIDDKPIEPWLSVADVCRILQVSAQRVGGWINSGQLTTINVGANRAKYRICPDSFAM